MARPITWTFTDVLLVAWTDWHFDADNPAANPDQPRLAHGFYNSCVVTATLLPPTPTPNGSVMLMKIRFAAGSSVMSPVALTKNANVGVSLALTWVVTVGVGGFLHSPVEGSV